MKREKDGTPIQAEVLNVPESWFEDLRATMGRMFPHLFLTGAGIAKSLTSKFIRHLFLFYDGRYEQDPEFVTTAFSLKMLQTTMTQGWNCKKRSPDLLNELGTLINNGHLEEQLELAKECPKKKQEMDTVLGRYFSIFSKNTPFSSLSMARARGRVSGGKMRRNVGLQFITGAPPEHEDDFVLRIAAMQSKHRGDVVSEDSVGSCGYNKPNCPLTSKTWTPKTFKSHLRQDPHARILLAEKNPGLVSLFFENELRQVTEKVLRCGLHSSKTTPARRGVCGKTSSAEVVVQLQGNRTQRLHYHIIARQHVCNVAMFDLCACHPRLEEKMRKFVDSVSSCSLPENVLQWRADQAAMPFENRDRPRDLKATDPENDYDAHLLKGFKKTAMSLHKHTKTCTKTVRGLVCCRLARKAPIHDGVTQPMVVRIKKKSNWRKKLHAVIDKERLSDENRIELTRPLVYEEGEVLRPLSKDPVLWMHHRPNSCGMVPEHNPVLAAAMTTSINTQIISNNASAECSDEYAIKYVTPTISETNPDSLLHLVSLTKLHEMRKYPTKAEDVENDPNGRAARTFGMKVVNSVVGRTEHSMALMIYCCLGHDAYESSDTHSFVYPVNVANEKKREFSSVKPAQCRFRPSHVSANTSVQRSFMKMAKEDDNVQGNARLYKSEQTSALGVTKTVHTFVTEAQLYAHRPSETKLYTSEECAGICDVVPLEKPLNGYRFQKESPLRDTHVMVLRRKQRTPVLGQRLPHFPGNRPDSSIDDPEDKLLRQWAKQMNAFAEVVVPMFSPWSMAVDCKHEANYRGLQNLLKELDSSDASLAQKGRGKSGVCLTDG